ncbi:MAG: hypothetical protein OEV06_08990 [Anaerolineae bacterium]|nr:hypothetical protein [Anaerolineae bacterium]
MKIEDYVLNYDPMVDKERIVFAWNGKHAVDFKDANREFRLEVIGYFIEHAEATPIRLIRDLYTSETKFAEQAWGVNMVVSDLAEQLLKRGGIDYLEDYLAGLWRGMDAFIASRRIKLSKELNIKLADACMRLANLPENTGRKDQLEFTAGLFESAGKDRYN